MSDWTGKLGRAGRGIRITTVLLLVLVALNGIAIWGIVSARQEAENIAEEDLRVETSAHARALEAVLATLRGDLIFLSHAPPLARAFEILASRDLFFRRQGRLDIEGTIYLFVESNPAIERLTLLDREGKPVLGTGRRENLPTFLSREEMEAGPAETGRLLRSLWPLGMKPGEGALEVFVSPEALLAIAAPTLQGKLAIEREGAAVANSSDTGLAVREAVVDSNWSPPIRWTLVRRESDRRLLSSVENLAERYRTTVLLNVLVMTFALFLGLLGFRQARLAARLDAENRHQAQLRDLERQVQHSDRLASIGRLAAGIAHEINNPLAGMSNYLSLLKDDLRANRTAEAAVMVDRVQEGLDRAAGIVRQVLTFADPGKTPREGVDLYQVLHRTVEFVRSNPQYRHLDLHLESSNGSLSLPGNATTLNQLFLNLVLNACHAQPEHGRIDVRARVDEKARVAVVDVEDRGPGISAEVMDRLFEPFSSTRGSTGLGLAICHGIVGEHGGRIRAENRHDGGARFIVELPLERET
jgi:signal transduction histidine kinase